MTPLAIFLIPGEYALRALLLFLQLPAGTIEPGLARVFAFILALLFWSKLYSICIAIIKRQFGFGQQGRN
jgi:hypothetical protein